MQRAAKIGDGDSAWQPIAREIHVPTSVEKCTGASFSSQRPIGLATYHLKRGNKRSHPSICCPSATGIPPHTFKAAEFISNRVSHATCPSYVMQMQRSNPRIDNAESIGVRCQACQWKLGWPPTVDSGSRDVGYLPRQHSTGRTMRIWRGTN